MLGLTGRGHNVGFVAHFGHKIPDGQQKTNEPWARAHGHQPSFSSHSSFRSKKKLSTAALTRSKSLLVSPGCTGKAKTRAQAASQCGRAWLGSAKARRAG